ncbi:MAG: His/Gly/Thr/Pro-type tRNA ligase C-terminal domain-containing protein [Alphaproteobacteria bacterium]|jgi:prolyl-tRNA synthetase|nr:His/Gly/Thr/Pro-type tRNA ligase C-terminal domain-containing protein [Alphaproteobacteria bacterium]
MKMSTLFTKTTKDAPKDAVIKSHQLLLRAGFIKQTSAGIYSLLPPAYKVYKKIVDIIQEEWEKVGAQEVLAALATPAELWKRSNRYDSIAEELLKFKDRKNSDMILAMTHEETIVHMMEDFAKSYKDYPFTIHQISRKFRDEARPRAGLIRVREFTMSDAYSFHTSQDDLNEKYEVYKDVYKKIFERVGVPEVVAIQADNGIMGGDVSHEYMLLTPCGEDKLVICPSCDFKANQEVLEDETSTKCPKCGAPISFANGIEVGNIFQLGTKYTKSMNVCYLDKEGKTQYPVMGCYGIGIDRLIASIAEVRSDEKGLCWPVSIAPWHVMITSILPDKNEEVKAKSDEVYETLKKAGVEVLYDDRNSRAGQKFSDAELLGVPLQIIISPKNIEGKALEVRVRETGDSKFINYDELLETVNSFIEVNM